MSLTAEDDSLPVERVRRWAEIVRGDVEEWFAIVRMGPETLRTPEQHAAAGVYWQMEAVIHQAELHPDHDWYRPLWIEGYAAPHLQVRASEIVARIQDEHLGMSSSAAVKAVEDLALAGWLNITEVMAVRLGDPSGLWTVHDPTSGEPIEPIVFIDEEK